MGITESKIHTFLRAVFKGMNNKNINADIRRGVDFFMVYF